MNPLHLFFFTKKQRCFGLILIILCCAGSNFSVHANDGYTLETLIAKSLASYPSVIARQSGVEAAQSEVVASKLRFLPNATINTQRNNGSYAGQSVSQRTGTNITINQPLFLDGGIIAGYQKADARLNVANFALLEMREDIAKRIINSYVEWMKAWLKIKALEENLKLHEKFVQLISRRYEQGVASGADRDLGVSRTLLAKSELEIQYSQEKTALATLSELVGEPITRSLLMNHLAKPAPLINRQEGIAQALAQSVTAQRFRFEAEAAQSEAKELRAQALPQLSFQAQRQIGNSIYPGSQAYDLYGLVLNYSTGGGFSTIASTQASFQKAKAAELQVETFNREFTDRLQAEFNEYEFAQLRQKNLEQSVGLSRDIASSYDRQYLVGRKSWLDLMNSVREQAQTKVQLADAQASLLGSSRRLQIYMNGLDRFEAEKFTKSSSQKP